MSWFSERRREVEPFASDDDPNDFGGADAGTVDAHWAIVGRFANVAEAGFFADELMHALEAPVRVRAEPSFDGMHHFWKTRYMLLAPETLREQATEMLAELVAQTGADEEPAEGIEEPAEVEPEPAPSRSPRDERLTPFEQALPHERFDPEAPSSGIAWAPIMLTLTAGSAVFFGYRWWHDAPRGLDASARSGAAELWETMSGSGASWRQPLPNGRGERTVRFTKQHDTAIIEDDFDRDGKPERTLVIRRGE